MLKRFTVVLTLLTLLVVGAGPAEAITDGDLDGGGHPYVGLMIAKGADGNAMWRCSGTLLSPTLFLTAGHCTEAPAVTAMVWFTDNVPLGSGGTPGNLCNTGRVGYPCTGGVSGTPNTHPLYDPNRFYYRDLGLVVLDSPGSMPSYGVLPTADQSDALKPSRATTFTAVGYGLQKAFPSAAGWKTQAQRTRMVAYPHLVQINTGFTGDFSLLLSNNANTGGTCFGDSGGPNFYGSSNVIAGVTSYGLNGTCAGTGGVYRLDRSWNLSWLAGF